MKIRFNRLIILATSIITLCILPGCGRKAEVRVEEGILSGESSRDSSVRVFKGIPYAAPPTGDLRWRPPRPPEPWTGTYSAKKYAPACPQKLERSLLPWTEEFMHQGESSEDCLYLNVWTGPESETENRPVMVYIHGGAFTGGSNAVSIYDGENLARKGIVFVSINYRVGPLGFLAHPELTKESDHHASGNYGLLDQAAALWWIRNNISSFGGDPDNVTVFGQSAGAMSVALLMQSPMASGLFNRAIIQSGPGLFPAGSLSGGTTLEEGERAGLELARAKGAASLADLRAITPEELLDGPSSIRFGPIQENWFLPNSPPNSSPMPVINGFTADDMGANSGLGTLSESTVQAYETASRQQFGEKANTFLSLYPARSDEDVPSLLKSSGRDRARVSLYLWAIDQTAVSDRVYTYYFDRAIPWPEHPEYGAFHSGELPYVFNNLHLMDRPWETEDHSIAEQLSSYWTNFAKTGDPNGPELPSWNPVDAAGATTMRLGTQMGPIPLADRDKFIFWKEVISANGSE